jgi:hypothetical protein
MKKLQVKHLEDVDCPMCEGHGQIDVGTEEYPHDVDCNNCRATGEIEIVKEFCAKCGEQLEWNEMQYGFDDETQTVYRCANRCEVPKKTATPILKEEVELPF